MSSSLTGLFGNALGDILSESLGLEPTDAELDARSDAAFARFDADASGALDFAEILAAFATMPIRALDPAVVRDVFDRFDADDSGTLDRAEFRAMMRALRSAANVDRMPGLIFCAGELANPSAHPELAERMRLERLYRTPYRPRSALAKAIAKKTKMNKPVYGGIDLLELSVLTEDSDDELLRCSDEDEDSAAGGGRAPRARARDVGVGAASLTSAGIGHTSSRRFKKGHAAHSSRRYASSRRKKLAYLALCALRFACLFLPGYVHPDEYHQSVEIAAADVLGARAAPRAWEFDEAAPARSALVPGLAAAWPLAIARETARFAEALLERTRREDSRDEVPPPRESAKNTTTPAPLTLFGPHASLVVFLAPRLGLFALSFALDWCAALGAKAAYWARGGKTTWRGGASAGLDARLCVASAWPTLVLATRPFANALEAAFLAMVLGIALKGGGGGRRGGGVESQGGFGGAFGRCAWTGALVAIGAWTRFTFVAFAAPSAAKVIADASFASDFSSSPPGRTGRTTTTKARRATFDGSSHGSHGGSTAAGRSSRRRFRPARCLAACVCFAGSLALAALACACADTRYFRGPDAVVRVFRVVFEAARETVVKLSTAGVFFGAGAASSSTAGPSSSASLASALAFAKDTLVVPPANAFLYNADAANLATHGIHPRATHALLNAPLAFGPTALFAYAALAGATRKTARAALERGFLFLRRGGGARRREGSNGRGGGGVKSPGGGSSSSDTLRRARDARASLAWSFWLPLLVLSAAPHQELRFLLPALVPLSALHGASALKTNARVLAWAAFNLAAVAVFGAAHQAGVAPAVAAIPRLLAEHVTRVESNRMESNRMERGTAAAAAANALEDAPTLDAAFSTVPGADAFAADATRGALDGTTLDGTTLDGTTLDGTLDGTLSAPPRDPPRVTPRVVFYRTYPPPVSLAGEPASGWFGRDAIVTDLMGARAEVAADALRAEGCLRDLKRFGRDSDDDGVCATLLVAPRPAAEEALAALERMLERGAAAGAGEVTRAGTEKEKGGGFGGAVPRATRVWRYPGPHFSGEEVGGLIAALGAGDAEGVARAMTLDVYAVEAGA